MIAALAGKELYLFGAGANLRLLEHLLDCMGEKLAPVEIWDNDALRQGSSVSFQGREIPVVLPHGIHGDAGNRIFLITVDRHQEEIATQIEGLCAAERGSIKNWRICLTPWKERIVQENRESPDPERRKVARYLASHDLDLFNNGLDEQYRALRGAFPIARDEESNLLYSFWNGKKIFLKRGMGVGEAEAYLLGLKKEQDMDSPHHYPIETLSDAECRVVLDAGAAEGIFALDLVDRAEFLYLVESDTAWIEALSRTFAPYADKVQIIPKRLAATPSETMTTMDAIASLGRDLTLVKMDIEGAECEALAGGDGLLFESGCLTLFLCSYHRHADAEALASSMLERGFSVRYSNGFLFFPYDEEARPELRHALVIAKRRQRARVYLWGAGSHLREAKDIFAMERANLLGVIDARYAERPEAEGMRVFPQERLVSAPYDAVFLTVEEAASVSIFREAERIGVPKEKLFSIWTDDLSRIPCIDADAWRLMQARARNAKCAMRLANAPFEHGESGFSPVRSARELLEKARRQRLSICRFGDGEFELMRMRTRPYFQHPDETLAYRLREILLSNAPQLAVCIPDHFGSLAKYTESAADEIRAYLTEGDTRETLRQAARGSYYDAYVTRPYMIYRDKSYATEIFSLWKAIWKGRAVVIVEGEKAHFGEGNDLLEGAKAKRRIACPDTEAWAHYEEILSHILEAIAADDLVLISLGPTATVLAHDLAVRGVQAIDIGQLDNEYDWYCRKAEARIALPGKKVAEVSWGRNG